MTNFFLSFFFKKTIFYFVDKDTWSEIYSSVFACNKIIIVNWRDKLVRLLSRKPDKLSTLRLFIPYYDQSSLKPTTPGKYKVQFGFNEDGKGRKN